MNIIQSELLVPVRVPGTAYLSFGDGPGFWGLNLCLSWFSVLETNDFDPSGRFVSLKNVRSASTPTCAGAAWCQLGSGLNRFGIEGLDQGFVHELGEALPLFAMGLVVGQTTVDDGHHLVLVVDAWQFSTQAGVTAELAAQLNPVAFLPCRQCACGTFVRTLATGHAQPAVDHRPGRFVKSDGRVGTGVDAGPATAADLGGDLR